MKRLCALIISLILVASLAGCDLSPFEFYESGSPKSSDSSDNKNEDKDTVTVPNAIGLKAEDAMKIMNDCGLDFEIIYTDSDKVREDYVVSQSPAAGKEVSSDTEVSIYVSEPDRDNGDNDRGNTQDNRDEYDSNGDITLYCRASEYATFRDAPSRTGKALDTIPTRGKVTFISTEGEFYKVTYKGSVGYVLADFFSTDANAPLNYGTGNAPLVSSDSLYCRASEKASLRQSPSRSAKRLAYVNCREEVTYLGSSGEFYYVSFRGTKGYVLKDYFSTDYNAPLNYGTY